MRQISVYSNCANFPFSVGGIENPCREELAVVRQEVVVGRHQVLEV